jgi:hypothetical protein
MEGNPMTNFALSRIARNAFAILATLQLACTAAPMPEAPAVQPSLRPVIAQIETPATEAPTPDETTEAQADAETVESETNEEDEVEMVARRMQPDEVTTAHGLEAKRILKSTYDLPMGSEIPFEVEGKDYMAKIEWHWHEPHVHPLPWGWHRGVSLYVMVPTS